MANGDEDMEIKIPHLRLRKTQRLNAFQTQGPDNHQFRIMEKKKTCIWNKRSSRLLSIPNWKWEHINVG